MYMTGLDITAETQNMKTEEPQAEKTAATAATKLKLPALIATSVVRGSQQGESHGGISGEFCQPTGLSGGVGGFSGRD